RTGSSRRSIRARSTCHALHTLYALRSLFALRALGSFRTLRALWSFRTFRTLRAWRAWRATRRLVRQAIPRRRAIADLVLERVSLVAGFARQQRRVCRSPERSDSIAPLHRNGDRGHGVPPLMSVTMMLGSITPEL